MTKGRNIVELLKSLVLAFAITGIVLVALAFAVLKLDLNESIVNVIVTLTYAISVFLAALLLAKRSGKMKPLWGMLAGILYIGILFAASYLTTREIPEMDITNIAKISMCVLSGLLAGMLA